MPTSATATRLSPRWWGGTSAVAEAWGPRVVQPSTRQVAVHVVGARHSVTPLDRRGMSQATSASFGGARERPKPPRSRPPRQGWPLPVGHSGLEARPRSNRDWARVSRPRRPGRGGSHGRGRSAPAPRPRARAPRSPPRCHPSARVWPIRVPGAVRRLACSSYRRCDDDLEVVRARHVRERLVNDLLHLRRDLLHAGGDALDPRRDHVVSDAPRDVALALVRIADVAISLSVMRVVSFLSR